MSPPIRTWHYALRWANPYREPPGPAILAEATVPAGSPCPAEIRDRHQPGSGYAICIDFPAMDTKTRTWSPEAKARNRTARLKQRMEKDYPLFAEELTQRTLDARSEYFKGK
jgi:hypothetical protein